MNLEIKTGKIDDALLIMQEAAQWLIQKNEPMWNVEDLTGEKILKDIELENIYTGYLDKDPAVTMILQWEDKKFWPAIKKDESGFIHKLAVKRKYAGKNAAKELMIYAETICRQKGVKYLRLDCAGNRPGLCRFYEQLGFQQTGRRMIGHYDTAFYEKEIK